MKKRVLSILLAVAVLLLCVPLGAIPTVSAAVSVTSYRNGDYLYTLEDGAACIIDYYGTASILSIPSTLSGHRVIGIGYMAFFKSTSLTSVDIPDSVTSIGNCAFEHCSSLTSVDIPDSVISIGKSAFRYTNLTSVDIPDSVTSIGNYAFGDCSSLTSVDIPDSVTSIGEGAFRYTSLTSVDIPDSVTSIGNYTFGHCSSLTSVDIPDSVTSIGEGAFYGCTNLTSVTLLDSVTSIGDLAFKDCDTLTFIGYAGTQAEIHAADNKIPFNSLGLGYLQSEHPYANNMDKTWTYTHPLEAGCLDVTFSADTCTEANYDFIYIYDGDGNEVGVYDDTALAGETVRVEGSSFSIRLVTDVSVSEYGFAVTAVAPYHDYKGSNVCSLCGYLDESGFIYSTKMGKAIIEGHRHSLSELVIPSTLDGYPVGEISDFAFDGCDHLISVTILDGVINIGQQAFEDCINLTSVTMPESLTSIEYRAFNNCSSLTYATIPDSVTYVGDGVFSNTALYNTASNWENNVLYIGNHLIDAKTTFSGPYSVKNGTKTMAVAAFDNCTGLTSLTIPEGITKIEYMTFKGCTNLTEVTIPNSVICIDDDAFAYSGLLSVTFPDSLTTIGFCAFDQSDLRVVNLGRGLKKIEAYAFACPSLEQVNVPDFASWLQIEFYGTDWYDSHQPIAYCNLLGNGVDLYIGDELISNELVIPEGITKIPAYAFCNLDSLVSVTIPASVKQIGAYSFRGCSSLKEIHIPDLSTWCAMGFGSSFYSFYYDEYYTVAPYLFNSGTVLYVNEIPTTELVLPKDLVSIPEFAFYNYTALTSITIPSTVTLVEDSVFYNCQNLTDVYYCGAESDWSAIEVGDGNSCLTDATIHYDSAYPCTHKWQVVSCTDEVVCSLCGDTKAAPGHTCESSNVCSVCGAVVISDFTYTVADGCATITGYTGTAAQLIIPDTLGGYPVVGIGDNAFAGCTALTSVSIPESVCYIGASAFFNTGIYNTAENWTGDVLYIGDYLVDSATAISDDLVIRAGTKVVAKQAFYNRTNLTSVTVPDSVAYVGSEAFYGCDAIAQVHITDLTAWCGVEFGVYQSNPLFYGAALYVNGVQVKNLTIPADVTTVRKYVFNGCSSLASVTIPEGVTVIQYSAFCQCPNLAVVSFPDSLTTLEGYTFYGCTSLKEISVPGSISFVGNRAFYGCTALETARIGRGVTEIGSYTFYRCAALKEVYIPSTVTSIGKSAFYNCTALTDVYFGGTEAQWNAITKNTGNERLTAATVHYNTCMHAYTSVVTRPSCTVDGYTTYTCSICGYSYVGDRVAALGHDYFEYDSQEPTCTEPGKVIYWCGNCYDEYTETVGGPLGHVWLAANCTTAKTCSTCGTTEGVALGHVYEYGYCSVCGAADPNATIGTLTFENATATAGDTVTLQLSLENAYAIRSLALYGFTYDEAKLELVSAAWADMDALISDYDAAKQTAAILFEKNTDLNRTVFSVTFRVAEDAAAGVLPVGCSIVAKAKNTAGVDVSVPLTVVAGSITVEKASLLTYIIANNQATITGCDATASGELVIPDTIEGCPVTAIGDNAFNGCELLTSVVIPDSVTTIGSSAFRGCFQLTSVNLSKNLTAISDHAFYYCTHLTAITIPGRVATISEKAFSDCSRLSSVILEEGVAAIETYAFYNCVALTTVTMPKSVTSIGAFAFAGDPVADVYYGGTQKQWAAIAMGSDNKPLTTATIHCAVIDSCTHEWASATCAAPKTCIRCGETEGAALGHSWLAATCTAPKTCSVCGGTEGYALGHDYSNNTCSRCGSISTEGFDELVKTYTTASTVFEVYESAEGLYLLSISGSGAVPVWKGLSAYASAIHTVVIGEGMTSIPYGAFKDMAALETVILPSTLTTINGAAFQNCTSLTNINLVEGITTIGYGAFMNCGLTQVRVPDSVTTMAKWAFANCEKLTSVTFGASNLAKKTLPERTFSGCSSLEYVDFGSKLRLIDDYAFFKCGFKNLVLPSNIKTIDNAAFYKNQSLKSIKVDDGGATYLGWASFYGCSALEWMNLGDSLTTIATWTFTSCSSLKKVSLPDSVTSIGRCAFKWCAGLETVSLPSGLTEIKDELFASCSLLNKVTLPSSLTSIGMKAFYRCASLTELDYDESVTVASDAFLNSGIKN